MNETRRAAMRRTLKGWKPSSNVSEAFGKLFAALKETQKLLKDYRINVPRLKRTEIPAWIAKRAAEAGFPEGDVFSPEMRSEALKFGVHVSGEWGRLLNEYFATYSNTGNPPEIVKYLGQGSTILTLPDADGDVTPVAIAWLTPYGNRATAMKNFEQAALDLEDRKGARVDPATIDDLARIHFMESFGLSSPEIAWEFLTEKHPEIAALGEDVRASDYADEYAREMDRLRQVRNRGFGRVTQIVPLLSRFDE